MPEREDSMRRDLTRCARAGLRRLRSPRKEEIVRELVDDLLERGGASTVDWPALRRALQREESLRALRCLWAPILLSLAAIRLAEFCLPTMNVYWQEPLGPLFRGGVWFLIYLLAASAGVWLCRALGGQWREAMRAAMFYSLTQMASLLLGFAHGAWTEACGGHWWAASYFALDAARASMAHWAPWAGAALLSAMLMVAFRRRNALLGVWSMIAFLMLCWLGVDVLESMQEGSLWRCALAHPTRDAMTALTGVLGAACARLAPMLLGAVSGLGLAWLAGMACGRREAAHV